jgi:hypothetical protein
MLFYITGGAPQAVPGTACVEANRTACIEDTCSSVYSQQNSEKSSGSKKKKCAREKKVTRRQKMWRQIE